MRTGRGSAFVAALNALERTVYELGQTPRRAAILAAPGISSLLRKEFLGGTDPYGREWAALRPSTIATGRHPPPLSATKRLRDGTRAKASPGGRAGLRLTAGAMYGAFAQVGFRVGSTRVAPRRIFPQFGIPREWRKVLDESAREATRQVSR